MYPAQPLQDAEENPWLHTKASETDPQEPRSSDSFLSHESPGCGSLTGRSTDYGSTAPSQQSEIHAMSSSGALSHGDMGNLVIQKSSNKGYHEANHLIVPVDTAETNANGHAWTSLAEIKTEQASVHHPPSSEVQHNDTNSILSPQIQDDNANSQPELAPTRSDEESEDLDAFLPLGVLDQAIATEKYNAEISILEDSLWIRTRMQKSNLRIYLDQKLTRRNNIQKSIKKIRVALKVLMSKIDTSFEAWEGLRNAKIKDSDEAEEESLWYIFNTLKDPEPQPNLVKDKWSRQAMEDLLSDDDFSEFGLKTRLHPYQRRSAATIVQREVQPAQVLDPRLQAYRTPTGKEYYYDREDGCVFLEKALYSEACGGTLTSKSRNCSI